jgi:GNAT superfamily N-acetyltransferase
LTLTVRAVTSDLIDDLGQLLSTNKVADDCWCMWFIIPVKAFHAAGREGNRAAFCELLTSSDEPLGLLAYQRGEPVGWCAVGPRSRYIRALNTPTYRQGAVQHDSKIWLVPCFFIRKDVRHTGVSRALLEAAVNVAKEHGATAIEGFPFSSAKRRSSGELQVGFESLFASCGFTVIRTPSPTRVVMRRELASSEDKQDSQTC